MFAFFLINIFGIFFVDVPGIAQHDAGQISRGRGGVDGIVIALFHQVGQITGVIDVRVRKDQRVDFAGIKGKGCVAFVKITPAPLEDTAFQKQLLTIDLQ